MLFKLSLGLSVISQLSSQGITPYSFSHCLRGESGGGGIFVLGQIVEPNMVYTPLVPSQPHYNVYLQSIAVNGQTLNIDSSVFATSSNRGTVIDSGTTLAYIAEEAYDPFVTAITETVSGSVRPLLAKGNQCYLTTSSVSEIFPQVTLNFAGGASMILRPQDYLLQQNSIGGAAVWCIGIQKIQGQGITILGDLVLKDKIVVYDIAGQRIGWANYDCSSTVNVSTTTSTGPWLRQLSCIYLDKIAAKLR
ncbi:aspartic proteinase 36-like [Salvia divinorum]|uniref:Aspartic proteinase 36-like n=1 Tax=Salvia divinorum TaxID=28513 RepID=A0ABD1GN33_SALDI